MKTYLITAILLSALFFTSCEEFPDQSEPIIDLGKIPLTDSTIAKLPYQDSTERIIFLDSLRNEYEAVVFPVSDNFREYFRSFPYENSDHSFTLSYQNQFLNSALTIPDLERTFNLNTYARVDFTSDKYEDMIITDYTSVSMTGQGLGYPSGLLPELAITADRRALEKDVFGTIAPIPTLTFQGREYKNVYTNENAENNNNVVYFNFEFGVIAFKDGVTNTTYFLKQ